MAVTISAADLDSEISARTTSADDPNFATDHTRAARLLAVGTQLVQDYAPRAPAALQNEAVIRIAGYLGQSDYGTIKTESEGPKQVEYAMNHAAAFRNSGAAMLLTRYKRRRAGAI